MRADDSLIERFPSQDPVVVERQEVQRFTGHVVGEVASAAVVRGVAPPQAF